MLRILFSNFQIIRSERYCDRSFPLFVWLKGDHSKVINFSDSRLKKPEKLFTSNFITRKV